MVFFNHATRQMTAKIVYYGPGLCGKTTNLAAIYDRTAKKSRGEMVSLNTETDRTLFFDLLPMEVGVISGFKAKLQLYTVPGQVFYNSTRKLVLKGVDGIVFVADSQDAMVEANRESLENLRENLGELGLNLRDIPMVFQWNKRDLKQIVPVPVLERTFNPQALPSFQAIARSGEGVFETLRGISRLALAQIKRLYLADAPSGAEPAAGRPDPAATVPEAQMPSWSAPTPKQPWAGSTPAQPWSRPTPAPPATPPAPLQAASHPGKPLAEALSFLDLPSALDLFDQVSAETGQAGEPEPFRGGDGPVKVLPPMVVRLQPSPGGAAGGGPLPGATNGSSVPHLALDPPGRAGAEARPSLQVTIPPGLDGDLELQVLVRHRGVVVAEASTFLPGGEAADGVAIEWKRV